VERDIYGSRSTLFEDHESREDNDSDTGRGSVHDVKEKAPSSNKVFSLDHIWSPGSRPSSPGAEAEDQPSQRRGLRPPLPQWVRRGSPNQGEGPSGDQPQLQTQSKDQLTRYIPGYEEEDKDVAVSGGATSTNDASVQRPPWGQQVKYDRSDEGERRGAIDTPLVLPPVPWPGRRDDLHNTPVGIAEEGRDSGYGGDQQQQHDEAPRPPPQQQSPSRPQDQHTVLTRTPAGPLHASLTVAHVRGSLDQTTRPREDHGVRRFVPATQLPTEALQQRPGATVTSNKWAHLYMPLQQGSSVSLVVPSSTSAGIPTEDSNSVRVTTEGSPTVPLQRPLNIRDSHNAEPQDQTHSPSFTPQPRQQKPPGVLDYREFRRKLKLGQAATQGRGGLSLQTATTASEATSAAAVAPPFWPAYGLTHYYRTAPGASVGQKIVQNLNEGKSHGVRGRSRVNQVLQEEQTSVVSAGHSLTQDIHKEHRALEENVEHPKKGQNQGSSVWQLQKQNRKKNAGVITSERGRYLRGEYSPSGGYRDPYSTAVSNGVSKGPVRGLNYQELLLKFGRVPNFSCRPEFWDSELCLKNGAVNDSNLFVQTLGRHGNTDSIMRTDIRQKDEIYLTEQAQVDVFGFGFGSFTSTGVHSPVLVMYTNHLDTDAEYVLKLHVNDTRTGLSGQAMEDLVFSPPPVLEGCEVVSLNHGHHFHASCREVRGTYYPVTLQFYYHFQRRASAVKTLFYHGAQTSIEFSLPSGLESNDYQVYVSLQAMDGKGVTYSYPTVSEVHVPPRGNNSDDVLSIFLEISNLENENPSLLLQNVRSLAWELNNIQKIAITQQIFDNIYARITCPEYDSLANNNAGGSLGLIRDFDILMSCARDHLTEIVLDIPSRDEMETIQVLSALTIIIDADVFISSKTFNNTVAAMATAHHKTLWDYNSDLCSQVAKDYFMLTSSVLDKQTELIDQNQTTIESSKAVIQLLLDVMNKEVKTRFLDEEPLEFHTSTLSFHGYLADRKWINKWSSYVPFRFVDNDTIPIGVITILSIIHQQSPYMIENDPIKSEVLNVHTNYKRERTLQMHLKRSKSVNNDGSYDFRHPGMIKPESISVYKFTVTKERQEYAFHVLLQIEKVTSDPISAKILICKDLKSLSSPLYKVTVEATEAEATLFLPGGQLDNGQYYLIIIDTLSYDRLVKSRFSEEPHGSSSGRSAEFLISAWWSRCLPWNGTNWDTNGTNWDTERHYCNVTKSSWDYTNCTCRTTRSHSVYGVATIPILTEEDNVPVNQLMIQTSYAALYFIILVIVMYIITAAFLQVTQKPRLKMRNIWLRDNTSQHDHSYLLTIKTGAQHKADTESKVYVILHGTHGMSATRELQSQQTGQLFTRGSICSFILTTPEALGDILKVQVWHDNTGGERAGWYICEVSVSDLVSGATFTYPCYRWLSVSCEDARVEREITLETPTTFWQDLENFLPQYVSEHILWSSFISSQSSHVKLYRLQRLTVCLIIVLCMGAASLAVVQQLNSKHTMMTPDLHIEPLIIGLVIAAVLLPLQGLLDAIFKNINKMEETELNTNMVLDTLKAVTHCNIKKNVQIAADESSAGGSDRDEVFDPDASLWQELSAWAQTMELSDSHRPLLHPAFREDMAQEMQIKHRRPEPLSTIRTTDNQVSPMSHLQNATVASSIDNNASTINQEQTSSNKKCTPRFWNAFNYFGKWFKLRRRASKNISHLALFEGTEWCQPVDECSDDGDEEYVSSSPRLIFMQCMGWMLCCFIIGLCISSLVKNHTGMTRDYSAPWLQILYCTICFYVFVMQPLVMALYTLGVVVIYRWFGSGDCITTCVGARLDQVVAIWRQYQTLLHHYDQHHQNSQDKLLKERKRSRDLRFAHPPKEDYLFKCRAKELKKSQVRSFLKSLLRHISLLLLLFFVMMNFDISQRYLQNSTSYKALINGTCLEDGQYIDPCSSSELLSSRETCNQKVNEEYMRFQDINTKKDWWKWAYSELLELVYNTDEDYSTHKIFCDTNSIIVGMPRLRKYDVNDTKCDASEVTIGNSSFADLLKIPKCFPDYVDSVSHTLSFMQSENKTYEWDTHILGITYGKFSHYSYTPHHEIFPDTKIGAMFQLVIMELTNWLDSNNTRAVITEFTLYHPQSRLYSSINLIAEFPSLSGAETQTVISSTHVERYHYRWDYVAMLGEIFLVAIAMYYLYKTCVYLYICKLRVWNSFWGMLDILMMLFAWGYIVCLMLRVQIAEDIQWQLKVAYFQKFVNIKTLTTWDEVLESLIGMLLTLQLVRCLRLMRFNERLCNLGLVIASAIKDVAIITMSVVVVLICLAYLGNLWFGSFLHNFHSFPHTLLTLIRTVILRLPLFNKMLDETHGWTSFMTYIYFFLCWLLLYHLTRTFYKAAFIYNLKHHIKQPRLYVTLVDVRHYFTQVFGELYCNMKNNWATDQEQHRRNVSDQEVPRSTADVLEEPGSDDDHDEDSEMTILADETPPGLYISELEQQLNQVMAKLPPLAQSLGIIQDTVEEELQDEVAYDDKPFLDTLSSWHPEEEFVPGRVKSSTFKTELERMLEPLQSRVREVMQEEIKQVTEKQNDSAQSTTQLKTTTTSFNLEAFEDMVSCHTELDATTQSLFGESFSASLDQATASTLFKQDGSQLAKFLRDVTAASEESLALPSYGKYGRTFNKINTNSKLLLNNESIVKDSSLPSTMERNMWQNHSHPHESLLNPQNDNGNYLSVQFNTSSTHTLGSRLRRTQTQGRGKGHVNVLDIEALELDSDNETIC
ncbi:unnamed protein product, partial [Meganyctiphanes norvegica]